MTRLGGVDFGSPVLRQSLLYSFWDGIFANAMLALNENFGTAAAVRLHAPNWVFPLLTALPILLGAACQFLLPVLADPKRGRKHYVLFGVRMQSLGLFLCGWAGWLPESLAAYVFVGFFIFAGVSGTATGGFWMAWMGDLVPPSLRGRHFAWRNGFFYVTNLVCGLLAGLLARHFSSQTAPWLLFTGVFAVSAAFRFISYLYLQRQHEMPSAESTPAQVHRYRPPRGLTSFAIATSLFQGAASVAGIFFSVWYLRDLHFNYLAFSIATSCTVFGSILAIRWWGHLIDRRGCLWVLRISSFLIIFIPLPYLFTHPYLDLGMQCFRWGLLGGV